MVPSLFGRSGIRVLFGERNDAHHGFNNAILDVGEGKWIIVYRRAANHEAVSGSQICAVDTYDCGVSFENERVIFCDPSWDTRNFVAAKMADGRIGVIAARLKKSGSSLAFNSSVFIFSDDGGEVWGNSDVPLPAPNHGHSFHGSMIDYPSCVGGNDYGGFIAYSYGSTSGNIDALATLDNGDTWQWHLDVAVKSAPVMKHLEMACVRVGDEAKWVMIIRSNQAAGELNAFAFVSCNPLNFPSQVDTGVHLGGNPPQLTYDPLTGLIWFFAFGRRGRPIEKFENHLLAMTADALALYDACGNFSSLGAKYDVLAVIPDEATGYIHPFLIDGSWHATFVCGEDGINHAYSKLALIGDFSASSAENSYFASELSKRVASALPEYGTYTPSLYGIQNVQALGAGVCHFTRVGNQVSVWGVITVDPTTIGEVKASVSLPIPSSFSSLTDCRGVASTANAGQRAGAVGTSIDQKCALLVINAEIANNTTWSIMFSYELKR